MHACCLPQLQLHSMWDLYHDLNSASVTFSWNFGLNSTPGQSVLVVMLQC